MSIRKALWGALITLSLAACASAQKTESIEKPAAAPPEPAQRSAPPDEATEEPQEELSEEPSETEEAADPNSDPEAMPEGRRGGGSIPLPGGKRRRR